jgi:hypothetical protein
VIAFIKGLLALLDTEDEPIFVRSQMMNRGEELQNTLAAAEYLDRETVTERVLAILGCPDKRDEVMKRKAEETR